MLGREVTKLALEQSFFWTFALHNWIIPKRSCESINFMFRTGSIKFIMVSWLYLGICIECCSKRSFEDTTTGYGANCDWDKSRYKTSIFFHFFWCPDEVHLPYHPASQLNWSFRLLTSSYLSLFGVSQYN